MDRWKGWAPTSKHDYYFNSILACASLTSLGNYSLFPSRSFVQRTNKQGSHRFTQAQGTLKSTECFKETCEKNYSKLVCVNMQTEHWYRNFSPLGIFFLLRHSFWKKTFSHIMFSSPLFFFIPSWFIAAWDSPCQENLDRLQEVPNYRKLRFFTASCSFHCWTLLKQMRLNEYVFTVSVPLLCFFPWPSRGSLIAKCFLILFNLIQKVTSSILLVFALELNIIGGSPKKNACC